MARVLVARTGSVVSTGGATSKSEGLETVSIVRHLKRQGHDVILYGQVIDDYSWLEQIGVKVIVPNIVGVNNEITLEAFHEKVWPSIEQLQDLRPQVWVNVAGGAYTRGVPTTQMRLLQAGIRYSGPILYANAKLRLPRVCVVTDPKCYPHEFEMTDPGGEANIPIAVLSQEHASFEKRINYSKWMIHARYSACEYWMTDGMMPRRPKNDPKFDVVIVANSHFTNPRVEGFRTSTWEKILKGFTGKTAIIGHGWEGWDNRGWLGTVPSLDDVINAMHDGWAGSMIPQKRGFNTTKIRLYALAGCAPLPHGRGEHLTYDVEGKVLDLDHPARISTRDGLTEADINRAFTFAVYHRDKIIHEVLEKTKPDFSMLDEVVDWVAAKRELNFRFGGYQKL